jgi:hypothetical protein
MSSTGLFNPRTEQFYKELPIAQRVERYVCDLLKGELTQEGDKDGDVLLPDGRKVEVKYDKLSKKTGRVAIEYEAYGNKKGIEQTEAYFYFIVCYDRTWSEIVDGIRLDGWWIGVVIKTETLLSMVKQIPFRDTPGGDNNATKMKLVPIEDIREASIQIFPIKH